MRWELSILVEILHEVVSVVKHGLTEPRARGNTREYQVLQQPI